MMFNKKHRIFGYSSKNSGPLVVPPPEKKPPRFSARNFIPYFISPNKFYGVCDPCWWQSRRQAKPPTLHCGFQSGPMYKIPPGPNHRGHKNTSGPFLLPPTSSTLISVQSMLLDDVATAAFNAWCKEINTHFPELLNHLLCLSIDYNMRPKYNQTWAVTTNLCWGGHLARVRP